jgi:hypothetical protein
MLFSVAVLFVFNENDLKKQNKEIWNNFRTCILGLGWFIIILDMVRIKNSRNVKFLFRSQYMYSGNTFGVRWCP